MSVRTIILKALLFLCTTSVSADGTLQGKEVPVRTVEEVLGESFEAFLRRFAGVPPGDQDSLIDDAFSRIGSSGNPLVTDSSVHFLYRGPAKRVSVPSDMNAWEPGTDSMTRVEGSDLFFLTLPLPRESRMEYKFTVDSVWMMDPVNPRKALGGYGYNSEVWMPGYHPPPEIVGRDGINKGRLDTLFFESDTLKRTHPVFVYLPFGYTNDTMRYKALWVTDGGEYLTLGLMKNVLDNMIDDQRIRPVVGIFVDPRTDPNDSRTSRRMEDYTLNSQFLHALISELRPQILSNYRIAPEPAVIMGASLGGLFSTYASMIRPDIFSGFAAQSPAYWWDNGAIFDLVKTRHRQDGKFYIDTGTIRDAQAEASRMYRLLIDLGYQVSYSEHPEGHNPVNWRARIDDILGYFFGVEQ